MMAESDVESRLDDSHFHPRIYNSLSALIFYLLVPVLIVLAVFKKYKKDNLMVGYSPDTCEDPVLDTMINGCTGCICVFGVYLIYSAKLELKRRRSLEAELRKTIVDLSTPDETLFQDQYDPRMTARPTPWLYQVRNEALTRALQQGQKLELQQLGADKLTSDTPPPLFEQHP